MINKQKNEKTIKTKTKNNIIPSNNNIKNTLLSSQLISKSNSNKSETKFNLKRIKNNSITNFIEKKKDKQDNIKKKINLRNINQINEKQKTITTKKNNIINKINTKKTQDNLFNIYKLSQFLKNTDFKQTIIIDDQGNNNLNLIMKESGKNVCEQNAKIQKEIIIDNIKEEINDENINSDFTSLFLETSNQNNIINKEVDKKQNIGNFYNNINIININKNNIKKKEANSKEKDNKRIDEYSQIFKLLNENIEQFKTIIQKKDININNKEKRKSNIFKDNLDFLSSRENYKTIQNEKRIKSTEKINKIILFNKIQNNKYIVKNQSKNFKSQSNKNKFKGNKNEEINNNISLNFSKEKNISNIYSFLDSFTQDDLFKPFDSKHQKKSSKSLTNIFKNEIKEDNNTKKINKKEIDRISSNEMSTNNKCEDDDIQMVVSATDEHIKSDKLKNRDINPHFFSNDFININNKNEKKNVYKDCLIY